MTTTNITNVSEASWSNANPNELDYLRPNAFKFQIHNIPNTSYFCNAANIPEMNLQPAIQPNPLVDIGHPGDKDFYFCGKEVIPGNHKLSVGVVGSYSRRSANQVVSEADLVFFVESSRTLWSRGGFPHDRL